MLEKLEQQSLCVVDLLDRLDETVPLPDGAKRCGRWLKDGWRSLQVLVVPDWFGLWPRSEPGVSIALVDHIGRVATPGFVGFDDVWLTPSQIERLFGFVEDWKGRRASR